MGAKAPNLEDSVVYQCRGTFRAFETVLQRWLREYDLQIAHFDVLRVLWDGDGVTQAFLAEKIFITESSIAQVLNQMEKLKLVERRIDSNDRRKRLIYLLPKAMEMKDTIITTTGELYGNAIEGLNPDDVATYVEVSKKLRKNAIEEYNRRWRDG